MKKVFLIIVALLLYLSAVGYAQNSSGRNEFKLNGITYVITSDTTVSVAGRCGSVANVINDIDGNVVLPSKVLDYTLTGIENNAFANTRISYIEIPETVTSIGTSPFKKSGLTSIKLPNSIKDLNFTFYECYQLKTVEIPRSVERLNGTFSNSAIQTVVIPNTVRKLGDNCFANCFYLKDVILEEGRENPLTLGRWSIGGNIWNLNNTPIDTIESNAFAELYAPNDLHFGSVGVVKPHAFYNYGNGTDTLSIVFDKVDVICDSAFVGGSFETISIPENVKVGKHFLPTNDILKNFVCHLSVPPYDDMNQLRLGAKFCNTFLFVPKESLVKYRSTWKYGILNDPNAFKDILPLDDYYSGAYKNWDPSWIVPSDAIEDVMYERTSKKSHAFDLQGRRLEKTPAHGLYIQNGKKIVK